MGYQEGVSKCVRIKIVNRELKQVEENIKIWNEPLTLQSNLCVFVHLSEIRDQTHDVARDALVAGQGHTVKQQLTKNNEKQDNNKIRALNKITPKLKQNIKNNIKSLNLV